MPELSVLIPARQEMWLARTIQDVLEHARGDTEVIAVLDGAWADPPIPDHPRLRLVHHSVPIGQRAATNLAARISQAPYLMKLDAHCSVDEGFDVKLIEAARELGDDVTQIPAQYNFHIFDRVCRHCGYRTYQGPLAVPCAQCQATDAYVIEPVWQPRLNRKTTSWRLDLELHFQYDGLGQKRQQGDLCDVMTSLGACWFMRRDRFWQLGGLDEAHGSWGQYGAEIGLKSWLSGGRQVVNKRTWFAHFFRVGGIGFPYPISGSEQERARQYSRALWFANAWPGQTRPLSWLIEHFAPLTDWHDPHGAAKRAEVLAAGAAFRPARTAPDAPALDDTPRALESVPSMTTDAPRKAVLYYSDNRLDPVLAAACQRQLRRAADGLPIISVTLQPIDFGDQRLVLAQERGYLTMFQQILAGLEAADADVVYFAEHDVLYPAEHFAFVPPRDRYAYNEHVYKVRADDGHALTYWCSQTSALCADRALLLAHYRTRVARVAAEGYHRNMGFEPGKRRRHGGVDDVPAMTWRSTIPLVDIRHGQNLTPSRWRKEQFRDQRNTNGWTEATEVPGWGRTAGRFAAWLEEVTR